MRQQTSARSVNCLPPRHRFGACIETTVKYSHLKERSEIPSWVRGADGITITRLEVVERAWRSRSRGSRPFPRCLWRVGSH